MSLSQILNSPIKRTMLNSFAGFILLAIASQISIPLKPVPISLHTVGVMLVTFAMDRRSALNSILMYIFFGSLVAPVFANLNSGIAYLLGPTGGYIFGFAIAIFVMSSLRQKLERESWLAIALICLAGHMIIFACGISYLTSFIGIEKALQGGLIPFILPGIVKIFILSSLLSYLKRDLTQK